VVRNNFLTIYLTSAPTGAGKTPEGQWRNGGPVMLQDLDNPARSWNAVQSDGTGYDAPEYFTFQNVTAKRFTLISPRYTPNYVFDEIIMPDKPD
jgi:hypothetical protein